MAVNPVGRSRAMADLSAVGWTASCWVGCATDAVLLAAAGVVTPTMTLSEVAPLGKNAFTRYLNAVAAGAAASVYAVAVILSGVSRVSGSWPIPRCST